MDVLSILASINVNVEGDSNRVSMSTGRKKEHLEPINSHEVVYALDCDSSRLKKRCCCCWMQSPAMPLLCLPVASIKRTLLTRQAEKWYKMTYQYKQSPLSALDKACAPKSEGGCGTTDVAHLPLSMCSFKEPQWKSERTTPSVFLPMTSK